MLTCTSCSAFAPDGARFCPGCGAEVSSALGEERRVVTVLFADIVGFTTLSEHADPEQVKRLVDGIFQKMVEDVVLFGGHVDKIIGDCIVALFGAPITHDDDAERAVRAALKMQQTLSDHNREAVSGLQMRIGINTGEVLVGASRAGGAYTAMGDVVNTASRLQSEAPPGRVLVGQPTKVLTDRPIRYSWFESLTPRGREQSIDAWLAEEVSLRPGRRRRERSTPMIGRAEETQLLLSGVAYAVARQKALLVAIDGEGGVGKSRLAEEIVRTAREAHGLSVLVGACVAYGEANVWWPIATALSDALGLGDMEAEGVRRTGMQRAAELLGRADDDPEIGRIGDAFLHLVGQPSALDRLDAVRAREELTRALITVLHARCNRGPLLLAIADVHWADTVVLNLLEQLLTNLANLPFVLLTTARPDVEVAWPPMSPLFTSLHLRLEPLDRSSTEQLAAAILGDSADSAIVASLYDRSGGNPLFLEELATLVADGGHVGDLPDSLRTLVSARLDQLTPDQRAMLDNAAVLGASGSLTALLRFAEALGQHGDSSTLDALVDAGLLAREGRRWSFRSQSVRDVAYNTLTKAVRAVRHYGIAESLATIYERFVLLSGSGGPNETTREGTANRDEIAHHYATTAELVAELGPVSGVPGDVVDRAVRWLTLAAERASGQHYMRSAVRLATRGLDLLGEEVDDARVPSMLRLCLIRAASHAEQRNIARARADLDRVLRSSELLGDLESEAEARRILGTVVRLSGNLPGARDEFSEAVRLFREVGKPLRLARALRDRAFVELLGGDLHLAEQLLDEAERLTQGGADAIGLAWVEWHRAWLSFISGDLVQAEARLDLAQRSMTAMGDRGGLGWAQGLLAYVRYYQGRTDEASELADRVLEEALDRGDDWAAGMMQSLQANLWLWRGRTEDALKQGETARTRFKRMGDGFGELLALAPLTRATAALGRASAHQRTVEEMHLLGDVYQMQGLVLLTEAASAAQLGESERAVRAAELAVDTDRARIGFTSEAWVARALGLVQLGRPEDALRCLEQAETAVAGVAYAYLTSVRVLVDVSLGEFDAALARSAAVSADYGASYLDHVYAGVGAALAHARTGSPRAAVNALDRADAIAVRTGDVVAKAVIALARSIVDPEREAGQGLELDVPLHGWRRLFESTMTQS
ncbi:MAG: AAA family ATPase [Actinobacteria bacterium]|uniref:Unannotated protein n=1 Tax=freshwater metagenome TaxID=449393 RepID=A0A6J7N3Y5_9ZZZZ|nr:AAA family ATPase [Actinomycetota bacterium]MSX79324.1 AAA family ATPase [Actinomycetota bacterium]